jgi:glycosyltransferase involved in cell wall biosynthesis
MEDRPKDEQLRRHLVYVITEDWFFASHFLDRALAAVSSGYQVTVITRCREFSKQLQGSGLTFINIEFARRGLNPIKEIHTILQLRKIFRQVKPHIIHNIALKPVVLGSIAAQLANVRNVVNALVGMGYVFTSNETQARLLRPFVIRLIRHVLNKPNTCVVIENNDDLINLVEGRFAKRDAISLIKGAGVDLIKFAYMKEPALPLKVVMVSRMLRDKGVNEFVQAASLLRTEFSDVQFLLIGDIDSGNPTSISQKQLNDWNNSGCVQWIGNQTEIATLLAKSHVVCLPSYREGLPKSLIEAAAVGRPIVTTDVPGCREVVTDGINGFLVPPQNSSALAGAIRKLIVNPNLRVKMGATNRRKAELEFANEIIIVQTQEIYDSFIAI